VGEGREEITTMKLVDLLEFGESSVQNPKTPSYGPDL